MMDALFDLTDFDPVPVYDGTAHLLGFTREYFTLAEFKAAAPFMPRHHNWQTNVHQQHHERNAAGCELVEYWADLRCSYREHGGRMSWRQPTPQHLFDKYGEDDTGVRCQCVGEPVSRAACDRCRWQTIGDGTQVLKGWLDHAWPGWRDLPLIPAELQPPYGGALRPKNGSPNPEDVKAGKAAYEWAVEHYPVEWQTPGAPARVGNRRTMVRGVVSGYAPFGGFLVMEDPA